MPIVIPCTYKVLLSCCREILSFHDSGAWHLVNKPVKCHFNRLIVIAEKLIVRQKLVLLSLAVVSSQLCCSLHSTILSWQNK